MLSVAVKSKAEQADLEKLKIELRRYTDSTVEQSIKISEEKTYNAISMLRSEFDAFKAKDFADHTQRIVALEKKILSIMS